MIKALLVGIGGFFGAVSRYLVDSWVGSILGMDFPLGTMTVNITGSFLLGLLFAVFLEKVTHNQNLSLFLGYGFIGAYTTYSTFMLDSVKLANNNIILALVNIGASLFLGLMAVYLGLSLGKAFI